MVVAISSAIDASALPTIWSVTGSTLALVAIETPFQHERAGGRVAADRPGGRDDDGGVVLVHEQRAGFRRLAYRRARSHGHVGVVDPAGGAIRAPSVRLELERL